MSAHAKLILTEAIARLAVARGARAEDEDFEVYVEALEDIDAHLVARACRELWKVERTEYESALPSVGTIRKKASDLSYQDYEAARHARLTPSALVMTEDEAETRRVHGLAMRDKFLADLRAMIQSKRMPS